MQETIENAIEATSDQRIITVPVPAVAAVLALATYGGQDLAKKAVIKTKEIRANRKAKKALKAMQDPDEQ